MKTNTITDWLSGDTSKWSGRGIRNKRSGAVYIIGHVFQNGRVEMQRQRESKTLPGDVPFDVKTVRERYEACAYRTKATVYNDKKVAIAQIDGVKIEEASPAGQMIRFTVPGRLPMGEYILFLEDGRRVGFATWNAVQGSTIEQTIFYVPMVEMR